MEIRENVRVRGAAMPSLCRNSTTLYNAQTHSAAFRVFFSSSARSSRLCSSSRICRSALNSLVSTSLSRNRWTVSLCRASTPSIQYPNPAPTPMNIAVPRQAAYQHRPNWDRTSRRVERLMAQPELDIASESSS